MSAALEDAKAARRNLRAIAFDLGAAELRMEGPGHDEAFRALLAAEREFDQAAVCLAGALARLEDERQAMAS